MFVLFINKEQRKLFVEGVFMRKLLFLLMLGLLSINVSGTLLCDEPEELGNDEVTTEEAVVVEVDGVDVDIDNDELYEDDFSYDDDDDFSDECEIELDEPVEEVTPVVAEVVEVPVVEEIAIAPVEEEVTEEPAEEEVIEEEVAEETNEEEVVEEAVVEETKPVEILTEEEKWQRIEDKLIIAPWYLSFAISNGSGLVGAIGGYTLGALGRTKIFNKRDVLVGTEVTYKQYKNDNGPLKRFGKLTAYYLKMNLILLSSTIGAYILAKWGADVAVKIVMLRKFLLDYKVNSVNIPEELKGFFKGTYDDFVEGGWMHLVKNHKKIIGDLTIEIALHKKAVPVTVAEDTQE